MVEIKAEVPTVVTFTNRKIPSLTVKKEDFFNHAPIPETTFVVETVGGQKIGEFKTDMAGKFSVSLEPNAYIVYEKISNPAYVLDSTPPTVEIKANETKKLLFQNKPVPSLQVKKINSVTRVPIENCRFLLTKQSRDKIGEYKTDKLGMFSVPNLEAGNYYLTELSNEGYIVDKEPKLVEIKAKDSPTVIEVENTPASGLLIIKTDMQTGKPLKGVVIGVRKADGQRVQSSILDANQPNTPNNSPNKTITANGAVGGLYTTDVRP